MSVNVSMSQLLSSDCSEERCGSTVVRDMVVTSVDRGMVERGGGLVGVGDGRRYSLKAVNGNDPVRSNKLQMLSSN